MQFFAALHGHSAHERQLCSCEYFAQLCAGVVHAVIDDEDYAEPCWSIWRY